MNHEFNALSGISRAHGQKGAFVSEWSIDRKSLAVTHGRDLIHAGVSAVAGAKTDAQFRTAYGKDNPVRFSLNEVNWNQSGAAENAEAKAKGLSFNRLEDGHWDPSAPNDLYFLSTEGGNTTRNPAEPGFARDGGGLWRLRFDDIEQPELGGTLTLLLDGSEPPYLSKPDNMAIDRVGNLLIQEDPGNTGHLARIVAYRIADGARGVLATFDPVKFSGPSAITVDEESSGIIDALETIGPRWFLFDAQVHTATGDPETVAPGQLLALHVDRWKDVYDIAP